MEELNYIIVCLDNEIYDYAYAQINELPYAIFDNHFEGKDVAHIDERLEYYYDCWLNMEEKRDKVCFILFSDCLVLEEGNFSIKIREKFLDCYIIYFFQDLVKKDSRKIDFVLNKRRNVDLIYTFDRTDAEEYGLLFHNIPYSYSKQECIDLKYDISFVGQAKDRLDDIYKSILGINEQRINSQFYLTGVREDQKREDIHNIKYLPNLISYKEYIDIVKQSKCILEIMQMGGSGNTIRVPEAIAYNKLLLSNNDSLRMNNLYYEEYMEIFSDIRKVNLKEFLNRTPDYGKPINITPLQFLKDISDDIKKYVNVDSYGERTNMMHDYFKNRKYMPKILLGFDVHITEHCNLNCANCNHFSPIADDSFLDLEEYRKDILRLSDLFDGECSYINLMGGEPLLNKNINDYIKITRKAFPYGHIRVITNGLLIERMDELFWECCQENRIGIGITKYPTGLDYENIFQRIREREIEVYAFGSQGEKGKSFMYRFPIDIRGDNDPTWNYYNCLFANECIQLKHGKLYTCVIAANAEHLKKKYGLNISLSKFNGIDIHKTNDAKDILEYLSKPIPFCRYCDFEKYQDFEEKWHTSSKNRYEWVSFSFSKDDYEYLKEANMPIYVFGAGNWGRETVRRIKEENIKIKAILVSNMCNNPECIGDIPVMEMNKEVDPGICIIAVDGKAKSHIQSILYDAGFRVIIPLMKI
jgi:hypothetical protein